MERKDAEVIETARLRLRRHRLEDFDASAAMWADPDVTRFLGVPPLSREETWGRYLRYAGLWSVFGFGYWVIEERATGRFVGEAGFADFKREVEPPIEGVPEVGWVLAAHAHGQGYATEAARAAVEWGEARAMKRMVCLIHPENAASIRVAEKCGFRESRRSNYKGHAVVVFERGGWLRGT